LDGLGFVGGVSVETAPGPVFRTLDYSGFDGIAMDVAELLDPLRFCEDVEVVITGFPDKFGGAGTGETLLENLNRSRQLLSVGFGYEEMDVVRHENVTKNLEEVFLAGLFENLLESITGFGGFEDVGVAVAADGDEMEVAGVLATI
jgi:hypothetical protein